MEDILDLYAEPYQEAFPVICNELAETHFPDAKKIQVVLDNLKFHSPAAFYETFPPEQARHLTKKFDFH